MEIFLGSHHFLLIMKHTPPPLIFPASAVLSIRKTAKYQTELLRCPGLRREPCFRQTRMLQSLMSRWKLVLALRSSILFFQGLDICEQNTGERRAVSPVSQSVTDSSTSSAVFLSPSGIIRVAFVKLGVPKNLQWPRWIRG